LKLKVYTAQNVLIELPLANAGIRLASGFLDLIVQILYFLMALWIFDIGFIENHETSLILILIPLSLYYPVCEYLWNGRTVGKFLLKLRVIRADGSAASIGDIILRWLLRAIDVKTGLFLLIFFPDVFSGPNSLETLAVFLYLPIPFVGFISMMFSKKVQRIGDLVANTVVIISKRPFSLEDTILRAPQDNYEPVFKNVLLLSDRDIYIIKNVLDNSKKSKSKKAIFDLAIKAKKVLKIEENIPPEKLLKTLIEDYNHLAKKKDEVI
tara:strand:- start:503 stop:1303 length:801 start_codon:yes stop_codon:yes gene_type:complete